MGYAEEAMAQLHGQTSYSSGSGSQVQRDLSVLEEIAVELQKARATHAPMNGHHEGYAVILEELDELWEVCKPHGTITFPKEAKRALMRKEALQVAAMAMRFIEDVCDKNDEPARLSGDRNRPPQQ